MFVTLSSTLNPLMHYRKILATDTWFVMGVDLSVLRRYDGSSMQAKYEGIDARTLN